MRHLIVKVTPPQLSKPMTFKPNSDFGDIIVQLTLLVAVSAE